MKNFILLVLISLLLFGTTACSDNTLPLNSSFPSSSQESSDLESSAAESVEETQTCQHQYTEHVQKEPGYGFDGFKILDCDFCDDIQYEKIPALPSIFEIKIKNKDAFVTEKDGNKECCVTFDIEIQNTSDKTIQAIEGTLEIFYKTTIMSLDCSFENLSLKGHTTKAINSYGYTFDYVSLPDQAERQIYDADYEDLTFSFKPSRVEVDE